MDVKTANELSTEILEACTLDGGKLTMKDETFADYGRRIQTSDDKQGWATMLIALANRLRGVAGAGAAAERVTALAAVALGDAELNTLLNKELAKKG